MKTCLFITTYPPMVLDTYYNKNEHMINKSYEQQKKAIIETFIGDSDFYSKGLIAHGWKADDIIANCRQMQVQWALENNIYAKTSEEIIFFQIKKAKPDVVYIHDMSYLSNKLLMGIKQFTKLIAGQAGSPSPPDCDLSLYDIIFSCDLDFVNSFRKIGITSYYQTLGFDKRIYKKFQHLKRDISVNFIGGLSIDLHSKRKQFLEQLLNFVDINLWGYALDKNSPLKKIYRGAAWSDAMFSILTKSLISLNHHDNTAINNAANMRLFEATGCGSLLITDYKNNLNDLFEIGKEIIAYRSVEECAELIKYYLKHPDEAQKIAKAGQERTFKEYNYSQIMKKTSEILNRHIKYKQEKNIFKVPTQISNMYKLISSDQISSEMISAWKSKEIPYRQRAFVQKGLEDLHHGIISSEDMALANCLYQYLYCKSSILEIGCSSGYYYEIIEYLLSININYTGVDYSKHLIKMAASYYPEANFYVADGANLPFHDNSFYVVISSGILLQVPNYFEHIKETVRVAKKYVVAHRTPICRTKPTQLFKKSAYGIETLEFLFNEKEIVSLFLSCKLRLIGIYEYTSKPNDDIYEVTYIFEKIYILRD